MAQVEAKLKAIEGLCTLLQLSLITAHEQAQGVRSPEQRQKLERLHDRLAVNTRGGQDIIVDGIVAGIGIQPNVELAQTAGLEVGNGIVVDEPYAPATRISMRRGMWQPSITRPWGSASGWNMKTTPIPWDSPPGGPWPAT